MAGPLIGGGGLWDGPLRKEELFWNHFFPTFQTANELERGGGLGLNDPAINRRTFFLLRLP